MLLDLLVPELGMASSRFLSVPALPPLTFRTFLAGVTGSFLSGVLFSALVVPPYNAYFRIRDRLEERGAARYGDRLRYF